MGFSWLWLLLLLRPIPSQHRPGIIIIAGRWMAASSTGGVSQPASQPASGALAIGAVVDDGVEGRALPGRFRPQFRDKNRRDIGKSQSIWTDSKMETAGSPRMP
eukprot:COSAG01_NODE_10245_length_2211_cov_2.952178_2_plen_104_part_00